MIAEVIHVIIAVHIVILVAPVKIFHASVAESVLVFVDVLVARNEFFTHVTEAVGILVCARNGVDALVAPAVTILVSTHIVEASIADPTFVFAVVDDAHVRHPYSTVVAEVIAHLVLVYVIFSCYGANGELVTDITHAVSIVVEAKIKEATGTNIADVVFVIV